MSFDGVFTRAMTAELNNKLLNGRLSKIHQPYDNEIILVIRNQGKNHKLLLSAHPTYARMQLTSVDYQNPPIAPNFCMMLRKYLEGAILQKIEQVDNDRIIHFAFSKRNELGDLENIVLVVELMGRHSTIVLVNHESKKILDCIKHVGPSQNTYRTLLPGASYVNPPLNDSQLNPFSVNQTRLFDLLATADDLTGKFLQQHFQGLGFDTATELATRLSAQPTERMKTWYGFWEAIDNTPEPSLSLYQGKEYFTPIAYDYLGNERQSFPTLSELLEAYYLGKAERERVKQQAGELIRKIDNEYKKTIAKIKKLEKALGDTENAEEFRQKGELLTTFLHQVERGAKKVTLENYYDENAPITINLREDLSPAQNAQKFFQKYAKLKNGVKIIAAQIESAKKEAAYLESVLAQLEIATPMDIDVIREELIEGKYIRLKQKAGQRKKLPKSKPEKYQASDGTLILVGKNNLQNDQLTLKTANKNDIWLHAKDIPGSHVIIQDSQPSETTIAEAANIAGYFSKFRLSSSVPIDYVAVRHVKKPNGAKPGYVIYENQQTIYVTPDKELVQRLKL
ncbi:NFACT family protein [Vagococcus sp. BWB3-3]|uniref:Rqc2 homolog RqcH n=1 Tax=Vagococcus allomyrinae TaxID=2794353 RepID=A0A940P2W9_9ENTE|nr:NFACT RNA binding domain-containing protein [Vagococcus allomyrinae]MBP1040462.1 NFACT family protein [Vagococcus allomyrinae]